MSPHDWNCYAQGKKSKICCPSFFTGTNVAKRSLCFGVKIQTKLMWFSFSPLYIWVKKILFEKRHSVAYSPIGSARMGVKKIHLGVIRRPRPSKPSNSNRSNERKIFKRGIRSLIIYGINHRTAQLDFLLSHKYIHQISRTREQRKRQGLFVENGVPF